MCFCIGAYDEYKWFLIPLIIITFLIAFGIRDLSKIETKTRIQPDIKIIIENGEADTTFIYRNF